MSNHRVTVSALYGGQLCQNVLHFINLDGVKTPQQIANSVLVNWVRKVKVQQTNALTNFNILVQNADNPGLAPFSLAIQEPGTGLGESRYPTFACMVLKYLTNFGGRSGRGRSFIPGIPTDFIQNWVFSAAAITGFTTNVITPVLAAWGPTGNDGMSLCVRGKAGENSWEYHPIIAINARTQVGVQRRRNVGIGV